jgi:uracil-DNA glycosylase family 4
MNTKEQILEFVKQEDPDNPLQYVHNIVRQYAMDKLNRQILDCRDCDICNSKKSISYGNPDATLMIIAESVSDDQSLCEDEYVYPFVNEAGEIFKKVISQLNVNTNELFVINAVNCWPHKAKNDLVLHRTPSKEEVDNCKVFVDHSIRLVQPKAIILWEE